MSATAARTILSVDRDAATVEAQAADGTVATVALKALKRPELLRAAKVAFPDSNGKAWFSVSADAIRSAIITATLPDGFDQRTNKFAGRCHVCNVDVPAEAGVILPNPDQSDPKHKWLVACQEHAQAPKADPTPPKAAKAPQGGGDALTEALRGVVADLIPDAPVVDEEQVRRIVAEYVDAVPARRVVIVTPEAERELPEGHHESLPELVTILGAGVPNVFLVGPAGSGKSTLAEHAAEALGREFRSISFGPTTPTSKLFGYNDASGNHVRTPFRDAFEHGHVFIGDELDNGHPGLIAELNQALANGYAAFADGIVEKHPEFRFVGTGNTFGRGPDRLFVGRNILDAATLDRFVTVEVPIDQRLERSVALSFVPEGDAVGEKAVSAWVDKVQKVRDRVQEHKLPIVVSPRATFDGAKLILAGVKPERVAEIRLTPGWSQEHLDKVRA